MVRSQEEGETAEACQEPRGCVPGFRGGDEGRRQKQKQQQGRGEDESEDDSRGKPTGSHLERPRGARSPAWDVDFAFVHFGSHPGIRATAPGKGLVPAPQRAETQEDIEKQ